VILLALAGAAVLAAGGLLALRSPRAGLTLQALGMTALGVTGATVLADGTAIGAGFRGGVSPALGVDALSGFFLALLAVTAVPALVFARGYLRRHAGATAALTAAFLLALVLVLTARDATTFLAGWELMTLVPAAAILVLRRDAHVRSAVQAYLAITHLGGAGVWIALLALADRPDFTAGGAGTLVAIAALIGFGTKAGLVPLHPWLPRAHPVAPAHLSALMSGMMIKVALYGLIRIELERLGATPRWLGFALLAAGLASAVGGAVWALVQGELKRLLAFSTIENAGIVALGLGATILFAAAGRQTWAGIAFAAALLHIANHAVFKVLLFLGAGAFERAAGTLELDRMGGLLRRMPWTGGAFLAGCAAIAGVPPLNGFVSEWLTLQALAHLAFDRPVGVAFAAAVALAGLAATAALALMCFVKVAGLVLLGPPRTEAAATAREVPATMRAPLAALAGLCLCGGIAAGLLVPALAELAPGRPQVDGLDLPGTGGLPVPAVALALAVLVALLVAARGTRRAAPAPSWACGQPVVPALSWTSAGFTKPLRLLLESVLRPRRELVVEQAGGRVERIAYSREVPSLSGRLLYGPVIRAGLRSAALARRLQTGNVRTYAAYLLALVLGLLALARAGALG
jgi:hydrogenase-4 component B